MKRGEIWVANLNPNRGSEVGKIRPVLILQNNALTESGFPTIVVLPLTSQVRKDVSTLRISITARDDLREDCQIMIDQPRSLDRKRIGNGPLTQLTRVELDAVEKSLVAVLGMM
jgi:mRNA interferase MazF